MTSFSRGDDKSCLIGGWSGEGVFGFAVRMFPFAPTAGSEFAIRANGGRRRGTSANRCCARARRLRAQTKVGVDHELGCDCYGM